MRQGIVVFWKSVSSPLKASCSSPKVLLLPASLAIGINQRKAGRRIVFLLQRNRVDGDKNLQRGGYDCLDQVSAVRRSIATAYHYVRVQRGLPLIQGEVTDHRRDFDLLTKFDRSEVWFGLPNEF